MDAETDFWRDRRVFVTGCTGLVGAWVVRALLGRGAHVVGLVRDQVAGSELTRAGLLARIDTVRGSVEDYPLMERALAEYEIQTIFHLAAQTIVGTANRSPLGTFETNIKGTWCLLEAARRLGTAPQVVVASSDKAYGDQDVLPYTEESPLQGRHPYDVSKSCTDLISLSYYHTYGLPACVTRCGNFYGGGDLNWNRIVPGTVRSVLRGRRPVIRSDGSYVRDYFYAGDGAAAYLHLAECMAARPGVVGQAFNFSTETRVTVLELTRLILELMGSDLTPDVRDEARNEIRHQCLSAAKARDLLGWRPRYGLREALAETVAWYREYLTGQGGEEGAVIAGVRLSPLRQIPDERGKVMHMLRRDDAHFEAFGEVYFSCVWPGAIKGWHLHRAMTLNYAVPVGHVKFVLYDERPDSPTKGEVEEFFLGESNYALVTVPPGVWNGFKGLGGGMALVANCATLPHDAGEIARLDPLANHIPYDWAIRHR